MKTIAVALAISLAMCAVAENAQAGSRKGIRIGVEIPGVLGIEYGKKRHTRSEWVPGHHEWREREVCVPGRWITVREPIRSRRVVRSYGECGTSTRYVTRRVWQPARTEIIRERVWVPGHYVVREIGHRKHEGYRKHEYERRSHRRR